MMHERIDISVKPIIILVLVASLLLFYIATLSPTIHAENAQTTIRSALSDRNAQPVDIERFGYTTADLKKIRTELTATDADVAITHTQKITVPCNADGVVLSVANDAAVTTYDWDTFDAQVDGVIALISKKTGDLNRLRAIYMWMIENIDYDETIPYERSSSGYYALMTRKATCAGYARLFMYLADQLDIKTIVVTTEDHAWVRAPIGGVWYNIDPTWGTEYTEHPNEFFCLSDAEIFATHLADKKNINPSLDAYPSPWPYLPGPLRP